MVSTLIELLDS